MSEGERFKRRSSEDSPLTEAQLIAQYERLQEAAGGSFPVSLEEYIDRQVRAGFAVRDPEPPLVTPESPEPNRDEGDLPPPELALT